MRRTFKPSANEESDSAPLNVTSPARNVTDDAATGTLGRKNAKVFDNLRVETASAPSQCSSEGESSNVPFAEPDKATGQPDFSKAENDLTFEYVSQLRQFFELLDRWDHEHGPETL